MTCSKCEGTGNLPHLAHIDNGVCYACDGTGEVEARAARIFARGEVVGGWAFLASGELGGEAVSMWTSADMVKISSERGDIYLDRPAYRAGKVKEVAKSNGLRRDWAILADLAKRL